MTGARVVEPYPLLVDVFVPGVPRTKGSLEIVNSGGRGRPAHVQETEESKRWRMLMVQVLRQDNERRGFTSAYLGGVSVIATFFQRVSDPTKKVAESGDLDKLLRNVLDALSVNRDNPKLGAGVIGDDMQVIDLRGRKHPQGARESGPGAYISVRAC